jgi:serine/threonine-protein kinase
MEYIEGASIDDYCAEHRLGVSERLQLFRRVCEAVAVLHQQQIVHRDLKPGNILVTESGEPKLLDFGLAALIQPADGDPAFRQTNRETQCAGTWAYMSPEQARGEPPLTASDVYSLGVLLFELLSGPVCTEPRMRSEGCCA